MAKNQDTKTASADNAPVAQETPQAEPKLLVRFKKNTSVSECGGVFAAGSTAKLSASTAHALEGSGFLTIVGA